MKSFLLNILHTGASTDLSDTDKRNITITNLISVLLFCIALILAVRNSAHRTYSLLILTVGFLFLVPLLLNGLKISRISRWIICVLPPIIIVTLSTINKKLYPEKIQIFNYLDVRFFLIGCMVIPLMVIQTVERTLLASTLAVSGLLLASLDLIFNMFEVGYYDLVNTGYNYYFMANFYCITSYLFILSSLLFEKKLSDKALRDNEVLISFLNDANQKLEFQKEEIAEQNIEIKTRTEELLANQEKLVQAYSTIEKQKEGLLTIQTGLQTELVERNKELKITNQELVRYNQELHQFSYTISHNLRGPLARLLGLTNLMEIDLRALTTNQFDLVKRVSQSANELDEVIRDLGKIIDIRNDIYRIREKVFFQDEWNQVLRSLSAFVQPDMNIETDFQGATVAYTVRPILTSILYNLASNAIKYRSPDRPLKLKIKTTREKDGIISLEVSDNGLGMNLEQFSRSMFGLYKRFHTHTDGKGLGLYLVKLQIESLGGTVEVASELNIGTTFTVKFKEPSEVEGQLVFESEFGSIFYNARTNCIGILWKKQVTSEEYRLLFTKAIELVRLYHTPFWISDLSKQGTILPEDQVWMVSTVLPDAVRQGLSKIVNVYYEGQHNQDYRNRIQAAVSKLGAEIAFFTDRKKAEEWIEHWIS